MNVQKRENELCGSNDMRFLSPVDRNDIIAYSDPDHKKFFKLSDDPKEKKSKNQEEEEIELMKVTRRYIISPAISVFNAMPLQMGIQFLERQPKVEKSFFSSKKSQETKPGFASPPYLIFPGRYLSFHHLPLSLVLEVRSCFPASRLEEKNMIVRFFFFLFQY
jgi:hypothetical protein